MPVPRATASNRGIEANPYRLGDARPEFGGAIRDDEPIVLLIRQILEMKSPRG
jgi:hypothetical protein